MTLRFLRMLGIQADGCWVVSLTAFHGPDTP